MTTTRYVVIQAGFADMSRLYRTPEAAQRAADRINATLERELGEECWGDGAASIMDIALPARRQKDAAISGGHESRTPDAEVG